ncbi:MAG: anthranilate synthase component II [Candidatus Syntropharchaeia archaeon]
MRILFIDNFDSFVWNLVEYISIFVRDTIVLPNTISVEEAEEINPDGIVISPGPGNPEKRRDIGCCIDLIHSFKGRVPILGVCLGHQAIAMAFGGKISHSPSGPVHGKASPIYHDKKTIFEGLPNPMEGGRYHSLSVKKISKELEISAWNGKMIMGIRHRKYPIEGVQFHPESVLTPKGINIINNFVKIVKINREKNRIP